jgi:excisionase family DNA binding protein
MRHTDPRITTELYGRLAPGYLRGEIDRLAFESSPAPPSRPRAPPRTPPATHLTTPINCPIPSRSVHSLHPCCRRRIHATASRQAARERPRDSAAILGRGQRIRTSDILLPNARDEIADDGSGLQVSGYRSGFRDGASSPLQPKAAIAKDLAPILLPVARLPGHRDRLLSVSEVAELLSVSDATVYALCARGILAHVRVLNAIRVAPAALNALLTSPHQRGGSDG